MNSKKLFANILNIAVHFLGFPLMLILAIVDSCKWNSYGLYGASSFAPIYIVLILWLIVAVVELIIYLHAKKKGSIYTSNTLVKVMAVPTLTIICLLGLLDIAIPKPLQSASSNTIKYEDVVEDYEAFNDKVYSLVETFKKKNNLDKSVTFQSKEFHEVFDPVFASMDKAYNSFDQLAIDYALMPGDLVQNIISGKIPPEVLATILLRTDEGNANNHNLTYDEIVELNGDAIRRLMLTVALKLASGEEIDVNEVINSVLVTKEFDGIEWNIFNILGSNPITNADPNLVIVQTVLDEKGNPVLDESNNIVTKTYGTLGYQDMAWINSIGSMFFVPLMAFRNTMYLFAACMPLLVLASYLISKSVAEKK